MNDDETIVRRWVECLGDFVPRFFAESAALGHLEGHCAILLHGSTTLGIDDTFSDLDLWLLAPAEQVRQAEEIAGTRFLSFVLEGKKGHFNLEAIDEMS